MTLIFFIVDKLEKIIIRYLTNYIAMKKCSAKTSAPLKYLGVRIKMGVYNKHVLSCNGVIKNMSA